MIFDIIALKGHPLEVKDLFTDSSALENVSLLCSLLKVVIRVLCPIFARILRLFTIGLGSLIVFHRLSFHAPVDLCDVLRNLVVLELKLFNKVTVFRVKQKEPVGYLQKYLTIFKESGHLNLVQFVVDQRLFNNVRQLEETHEVHSSTNLEEVDELRRSLEKKPRLDDVVFQEAH